jgi:hypothetical protein
VLNPSQLLIDAFARELEQTYHSVYGRLQPDYPNIIAWAGGMALENIANSDALFHNVEHTVFVALVGQQILRGRHIRYGGVSCEDWLHAMLALVCHDIGYVKGVCRDDRVGAREYATGVRGERATLPPGATDASLTPYHVDRGKLFVTERFRGHQLIEVEVLQRLIELTRFPVPLDSDHRDTTGYPGLVRAADLIGQLSDPRYLTKIPALFHEFEETGVNARLGYQSPADLRLNYPRFYWKSVYPYIADAMALLRLTLEGRQILANLYANLFEVEHQETLLEAPAFPEGDGE